MNDIKELQTEQKAVFIAFNQALQPHIERMLRNFSLKGYTAWRDIQGQGTNGGEPHLGSHAWPRLNDAMLVVVPQQKVRPLLDELRTVNEENSQLGLRAFVWSIEDGI